MMNTKTIRFFKDITNIPRESGNEKQISDYICKFAEERNLEYIQDEFNNVIIRKTDGINNPIILQAHIDMVCEKEDNLEFDFKKDKIRIYEEDGYLKARGTTLGADNGIGVAQILNILDSDLKINVEAIFTACEETTMIGAEKIDVSMLKGKQMINLDGFEEHTIITESASFFDIILKMNYKKFDRDSNNLYKISLTGMEGGHSGFDIDKKRGNSIIELANLLKLLSNIRIIDFAGGTKFNVIPSKAVCIFSCKSKFDEIKKIVENYQNEKITQYSNLNISLENVIKSDDSLSEEESKQFINAIIQFKHGVFSKNKNSQVTTSANLGVVDLRNNIIKIGVRSSRKEEEKNILDYLSNYSNNHNFELIIQGNQPGFETNEYSKLVQNLVKSYKKVTDKEDLILKPVHITVECGFFKEKIKGLEVAIISPKIIGAHTVEERVEIKSITECDEWLYEICKNIIG